VSWDDPSWKVAAIAHRKQSPPICGADYRRGAGELGEACRLAPKNEHALEVVRASSFQIGAVEWIWPNRFAYGKLGLLGGLPDQGKGLITAFFIACITKRVAYPCGEGCAPRTGSVIYLTAEDDPNDTVVPRLMAAGADLDRVYFVTGKRVGNGKAGFSLVTDIDQLRALIDQIGDVAAIVIDPMSAYVGNGKVNTHMTSEVRGFLTPLTDMAMEKHVFVLGVVHFNKKADVTNAMLRISDSLAYVAAARHVYVVVPHPEIEGQRLFVKAKNNLSTDNKALSYITQAEKVGFDEKLQIEIRAPFIVWGAQHVSVTASEAMQTEAGGSAAQYAKREAREFLRNRLEAGPVKSADLKEDAEQHGISWATLRRTQKELKIKAHKPKGKFDGEWVWELPAEPNGNL
jgi:putative DNA primase/helicase